MVKNLEQLGFEEADTDIKPRLIVAVDGHEKCGKSHFAMTAPGPIAYFNTDIGTEGVIHKFASDKDINVFDMTVPDTQAEAKKEWDKFTAAYYAVLEMDDIRSIVGDTATEWWELCRMAAFGKQPTMPYMYGPINAEFRKLIKSAYSNDKNLILVHKVRSVYINDKRTKEYERAGFSSTGYLSQVNVRVWREEPEEDEDGDMIPGKFHLYVEDCRHNPDMNGIDLEAPFNEFAMFAGLVCPDVDPTGWV